MTDKKPKKSPKKKLKPVQVKVPAQTITIDPKALAPQGSKPGRKVAPNLQLRIEAQALYLSDMNGCTVEEVHKDPRFKDIKLERFKKWSIHDDWIGKRKVAYANLAKRLTEETQAHLTEHLYHEVMDLQAMRTKAKDLLEKTPAQSWEGVSKVMLLINDRIGQIAKMVGDGVVDEFGKMANGAPRQLNQGQPKVPYNAEQLDRLAKAILADERTKLRTKLKPVSEEVIIDVQTAPAQGPLPGAISGTEEGPTPSFDVTDLPTPQIVQAGLGRGPGQH